MTEQRQAEGVRALLNIVRGRSTNVLGAISRMRKKGFTASEIAELIDEINSSEEAP